MRTLKLTEETRKNVLEELLKRSPNQYGQYEAVVNEIIQAVREKRDEAVLEYTAKFDKWDCNSDNLKVTEEEIKEELEKMLNLKKTIRNMIEGIEEPRYQAFLSYKYIQGLDMKEIGYKLNISSTPTFNLQTEALIAFEKKYGPKYLTTADIMEKDRKKYKAVEKSSKE